MRSIKKSMVKLNKIKKRTYRKSRGKGKLSRRSTANKKVKRKRKMSKKKNKMKGGSREMSQADPEAILEDLLQRFPMASEKEAELGTDAFINLWMRFPMASGKEVWNTLTRKGLTPTGVKQAAKILGFSHKEASRPEPHPAVFNLMEEMEYFTKRKASIIENLRREGEGVSDVFMGEMENFTGMAELEIDNVIIEGARLRDDANKKILKEYETDIWERINSNKNQDIAERKIIAVYIERIGKEYQAMLDKYNNEMDEAITERIAEVKTNYEKKEATRIAAARTIQAAVETDADAHEQRDEEQERQSTIVALADPGRASAATRKKVTFADGTSGGGGPLEVGEAVAVAAWGGADVQVDAVGEVVEILEDGWVAANFPHGEWEFHPDDLVRAGS
jgi:hypothetical protein